MTNHIIRDLTANRLNKYLGRRLETTIKLTVNDILENGIKSDFKYKLEANLKQSRKLIVNSIRVSHSDLFFNEYDASIYISRFFKIHWENKFHNYFKNKLFWRPVVNDDGSITYVPEKGDTYITFHKQYGITIDKAKKLVGTKEVHDVSGQDVYNQNPYDLKERSAVLKLDLKSKQATSSRIIQHFIFANDFSKSLGGHSWGTYNYFSNFFSQLQAPKQLRGNIEIDGGKFEAAAIFPWYDTRSKYGFFKVTKYSSYFIN